MGVAKPLAVQAPIRNRSPRCSVADQDIALLDLDAMKTFERAQFIDHQNIRRVEAAKALESSMEKVGAVVQRVCAHVTGLPKAAEVAESPLDKMFGGTGDKGKSLVALKEEAAERRRMLQRAAQEAGTWNETWVLASLDRRCRRHRSRLRGYALRRWLALQIPLTAFLFPTSSFVDVLRTGREANKTSAYGCFEYFPRPRPRKLRCAIAILSTRKRNAG